MANKGRIAAFGFRSVPSKPGCAGADKYAEELYARLVQRGYEVVGYNRVYESVDSPRHTYKGVTFVNLRTPRRSGLEALWHSLKATAHIIWHNTGEVVHVQNGGNSIFAIPLRLCGKKVYISEDGAEWTRGKWPWYARIYLRMTRWITARVPNGVIFDNVFVREIFEKRYSRQYHFVPFGSDPADDQSNSDILQKLCLQSGQYFLFVGRFIPDKGLQYLIPAFESVDTALQLVLIGGSTDGSEFERSLRSTTDPRVHFPGYLYGQDVHTLMRNAYAYVQPSDLEGLSPVVLENMGLGTPVICSDIRENKYVVGDCAITFRKGDTRDLAAKLTYALENRAELAVKASAAKIRAEAYFSWDAVTRQHEEIFFGTLSNNSRSEVHGVT
jgi:glycosyltransferase involved in cell wall biosynthesis